VEKKLMPAEDTDTDELANFGKLSMLFPFSLKFRLALA
jgi:hypothetical protein